MDHMIWFTSPFDSDDNKSKFNKHKPVQNDFSFCHKWRKRVKCFIK